MSGTSLFDTLGLSFADTTHQSTAVSTPVTFGSIGFGRSTVGTTSAAANPSTSSSGGSTAVTPMTSVGLGGGGDVGNPLSALSSVFPFISADMGLNGGQVQDPLAKLAMYGTLPSGVKSNQLQTTTGAQVENAAPSPIALGGIALVVAVGAYFLFMR